MGRPSARASGVCLFRIAGESVGVLPRDTREQTSWPLSRRLMDHG